MGGKKCSTATVRPFPLAAVSARAQNHIPETICMGGWLLKLAWALKEKLVKLYPWSTHNLNWRKQALASMAHNIMPSSEQNQPYHQKHSFAGIIAFTESPGILPWTATAVWKKNPKPNTHFINILDQCSCVGKTLQSRPGLYYYHNLYQKKVFFFCLV